MIKWQAFAPRRAPDAAAWLRAKGIKTHEELRCALLDLKIDPDSFPAETLQAHLGAAGLSPDNCANQHQVPPNPVETVIAESSPAAGSRTPRRGGKTSQPI